MFESFLDMKNVIDKTEKKAFDVRMEYILEKLEVKNS